MSSLFQTRRLMWKPSVWSTRRVPTRTPYGPWAAPRQRRSVSPAPVYILYCRTITGKTKKMCQPSSGVHIVLPDYYRWDPEDVSAQLRCTYCTAGLLQVRPRRSVRPAPVYILCCRTITGETKMICQPSSGVHIVLPDYYRWDKEDVSAQLRCTYCTARLLQVRPRRSVSPAPVYILYCRTITGETKKVCQPSSGVHIVLPDYYR